MLTLLNSQCNTATCFSPQSAIRREYWYIFWAGSTKRVSRRKYQIKGRRPVWYVAVVRLYGVNEVMLTYIYIYIYIYIAFVGFLRKMVPYRSWMNGTRKPEDKGKKCSILWILCMVLVQVAYPRADSKASLAGHPCPRRSGVGLLPGTPGFDPI